MLPRILNLGQCGKLSAKLGLMTQTPPNSINLKAAALLSLAPLLWSGNAIVGRLAQDLIPPMALNFGRWLIAFFILLPMASWVLKPQSPLWSQWRRFLLLGLVSVSCYNALQYLALITSSPLNVTLVAAITPVWMLLIGRLFFQTAITSKQVLGAALSIGGVLLVLARGQWALLLSLQLVIGDIYMLIASLVWAYYSWLLAKPTPESASIRAHWAAFLLAQVTFGLIGAGGAAAAEWTVTQSTIVWGLPLLAVLVYVAIGPAVLAYRAWGAGIAIAGPAAAGFFANLTPLFTAILSAAVLGETPQWFHGVGFLLIVLGIVLSSRR